MTSTEVVERAVTNDDGRRFSVRFVAGVITVGWPCGDTRTFYPRDIQESIAHIEALAEFPDVWLKHCDTNGRAFYARIVDGNLYANTTPSDSNYVPWAPFRKMLRKAAK